MPSNRRSFLHGLASLAGAVSTQARVCAACASGAALPLAQASARIGPCRRNGWVAGRRPRCQPDIPDMPWRLENGVKVFDIRVEHVRTELVPGPRARWLGVQRQHPGPDDSGHAKATACGSNVENRLPEPFSMHWHGLEIPDRHGRHAGHLAGCDPPGRPLRLRVHPEAERHVLLSLAYGDAGDDGADRPLHHPSARARTRRASIATSASSCRNGRCCRTTPIPNSLAMEFNWLTLNGKSGPATTPLRGQAGRARADPPRQPRDGSPSDAHARPSVLRDRHRGRPHPSRPRSCPRTRCSSAWRRRATSSSSPTTRATGISTATCRTT